MSAVIVLDAGPIGLITGPKSSATCQACVHWLHSMMTARARVLVPEIADFSIARLLQKIEATFYQTAREKGLRLRVVPSDAEFGLTDPAKVGFSAPILAWPRPQQRPVG